MVQERDGKKCSKHAIAEGEPAAKRYCVQLAEKPSKFSIPFNGTNDNGGNAKPKKRNAPQDNLSAQIYPRYMRIF